jgi:hypothetical protein
MNIEDYDNNIIAHLIESGSYLELNGDISSRFLKKVSWEIKNYSLEYEMKKELIPMNYIVP